MASSAAQAGEGGADAVLKRCRKCGNEKPEGDYYRRRNPSGQIVAGSYCKECKKAMRAENWRIKAAARQRKRDAIKQAAVDYPTKYCPGCELDLPKDAFYKQHNMHDGRRKVCIECYNLDNRIRKFLSRKAKARTKGVRPEA